MAIVSVRSDENEAMKSVGREASMVHPKNIHEASRMGAGSMAPLSMASMMEREDMPWNHLLASRGRRGVRMASDVAATRVMRSAPAVHGQLSGAKLLQRMFAMPCSSSPRKVACRSAPSELDGTSIPRPNMRVVPLGAA